MICDTSALIASLWTDQPQSAACRLSLESASQRLVSPLILAEVEYLIDRHVGSRQARAAVRFVTSASFELASLGGDDFEHMCDLVESNSDLGVNLADASLILLAKRHKTDEILTLDQPRFRALRGLDGRHFRILPFDSTEPSTT